MTSGESCNGQRNRTGKISYLRNQLLRDIDDFGLGITFD